VAPTGVREIETVSTNAVAPIPKWMRTKLAASFVLVSPPLLTMEVILNGCPVPESRTDG
jgi:hypothetical protein